MKKREIRQIFGGSIGVDAKNVTFKLQFLRWLSESGKGLTNVCCQCQFLRAVLLLDRRVDLLAQGARGAHGFQRARDDLRGTRTVGVVGRFGVQQFGVGQNDP